MEAQGHQLNEAINVDIFHIQEALNVLEKQLESMRAAPGYLVDKNNMTIMDIVIYIEL